jgi:hypothetical protein
MLSRLDRRPESKRAWASEDSSRRPLAIRCVRLSGLPIGAMLLLGSFGRGYAADYVTLAANTACSIAQVQTPSEHGTGFFIDKDGDMLTAAHVAADRSFPASGVKDGLVARQKDALSVVTSDGVSHLIAPRIYTPDDLTNAAHDMAVIKTGIQTRCHLDRGDPTKVPMGSSVFSMGFPGNAKKVVLFTGLLAGSEITTHEIGPVAGKPGLVGNSTFEVLRAQMPITQGVSGSPLMDQDGKVIGVMIEIPVVNFAEIQRLVSFYSEHGNVQALDIGFGNVHFDPLRITAELSFIVQGFETPGFGLAVPVSDLPGLDR